MTEQLEEKSQFTNKCDKKLSTIKNIETYQGAIRKNLGNMHVMNIADHKRKITLCENYAARGTETGDGKRNT